MTKSHTTDYSENDQITTSLHEKILGNHPRIIEVRNLIDRLAKVNLTVLITGETGTGKDVTARLLHKQSTRNGKSFIKVNCPSIPEGILESELFGYERGAFTGAHTSKPGRFELANDGTIFLDEICETAQNVQGKLLQVLDDNSFVRIGGVEAVHTNARVVAATNIPLDRAVEEGHLRKDIAFRLSDVIIHLPPLRERSEDIPLLAEHFNYNMCKMLKKEYEQIPNDLVEILQQKRWPGNIRELAANVKKYVATGSTEALLGEDQNTPLNGDPIAITAPGHPLGNNNGNGRNGTSPPERQFMPLREAARRAMEKAEKDLIEETLRYTLWNRRKAAKLLDTSYSSLLRRIEAYKIGKSEATL